MTAAERKRAVHSIQMTPEEWAACESAAALDGGPGTSERERTAAAWIRRVALKEAERILLGREAGRPSPAG